MAVGVVDALEMVDVAGGEADRLAETAEPLAARLPGAARRPGDWGSASARRAATGAFRRRGCACSLRASFSSSSMRPRIWSVRSRAWRERSCSRSRKSCRCRPIESMRVRRCLRSDARSVPRSMALPSSCISPLICGVEGVVAGLACVLLQVVCRPHSATAAPAGPPSGPAAAAVPRARAPAPGCAARPARRYARAPAAAARASAIRRARGRCRPHRRQASARAAARRARRASTERTRSSPSTACPAAAPWRLLPRIRGPPITTAGCAARLRPCRAAPLFMPVSVAVPDVQLTDGAGDAIAQRFPAARPRPRRGPRSSGVRVRRRGQGTAPARPGKAARPASAAPVRARASSFSSRSRLRRVSWNFRSRSSF